MRNREGGEGKDKLELGNHDAVSQLRAHNLLLSLAENEAVEASLKEKVTGLRPKCS